MKLANWKFFYTAVFMRAKNFRWLVKYLRRPIVKLRLLLHKFLLASVKTKLENVNGPSNLFCVKNFRQINSNVWCSVFYLNVVLTTRNVKFTVRNLLYITLLAWFRIMGNLCLLEVLRRTWQGKPNAFNMFCRQHACFDTANEKQRATHGLVMKIFYG